MTLFELSERREFGPSFLKSVDEWRLSTVLVRSRSRAKNRIFPNS